MIQITLDKAKQNEMYPYSNWLLGTFINRGVNYKFQAKIYPNPSVFGIADASRISKLWVKNMQTKKVIADYERGWNIGTSKQCKTGMLSELIQYLNEYAINNWNGSCEECDDYE